MAKEVYISKKPNRLKGFFSLLIIGFLIALFLRAILNDRKDPVINNSEISLIVEDWKRDMSEIGLDGDQLIKRLDYILVVDSVPNGFLNRQKTRDIMGRSDWGSRSIYILSRGYSSGQLKALVYHELAHYMFDIKHGEKYEIMATYIKEEPGYYRLNWDYLLERYLEKCKHSR
jgi:hypothetical protein